MNDFFFLDTYAMFEFIYGNNDYKKFSKSKFATTIFNIAELSYNLRKEFSKRESDRLARDYSEVIVEVTVDDICNASNTKSKNRKLSIPDCIGYIVAKRIGAKFLTGDKEFEKMVNVEFVK